MGNKRIKRINTKQIKVGNVLIGGSDNIVIQSMTNTKTANIDDTVNQIKELVEKGCQIVRVAVTNKEDAQAIKEIKARVDIPIVADIHYDHRMAILAADNGADKIRINPGNIGTSDKIKLIIDKCIEKAIPIRVGVNSGSLEKDIEEEFGVSAEAMVESASRNIKILNDFGFNDIIISMKASDISILKDAVKGFAKKYSYPLHLGVTEAGDYLSAVVKSTVGLYPIIKSGFGDTIRISITGDPVKEIAVAKEILKIAGVNGGVNLISCPMCGRTEIDLENIINEVRPEIDKIKENIDVAIMGCVVNGPGEAKHADFGLAGGKGKGVIFKKGKVLKTVDESQLASELIKTIKEHMIKTN